MFLGALLDWVADTEPTESAIAGAAVLDQGAMHLVAIVKSGGVILGNRRLEDDGIEPWTFFEAGFVRKGLSVLRKARPGEAEALPHFSTWGYNVIRVLAAKRFAV